MSECFVCVEPASNRYSVTLEGAKTLEQKVICDECVTDLREKDWIDVDPEPVLVGDGSSC